MASSAPPQSLEFVDWEAIEKADGLRLPYRGKAYLVPAVGVRSGALLSRAAEHDPEALAALADDETYHRALLGSAYDEMIADDVSGDFFDRALLTALADYRFGRITALKVWVTGRDPEALAAFKAATSLILKDMDGAEALTILS